MYTHMNLFTVLRSKALKGAYEYRATRLVGYIHRNELFRRRIRIRSVSKFSTGCAHVNRFPTFSPRGTSFLEENKEKICIKTRLCNSS